MYSSLVGREDRSCQILSQLLVCIAELLLSGVSDSLTRSPVKLDLLVSPTTLCCPMQSYGCSYKPQAIELIPDRAVCRFDYDACGIVVDWEPVTSFEVDYDRISYLPYNVMRMILGSLDSLSLRNLSATSKRMRELCYEMLYKKGIVTIEWESDNLGGWFPGRKIWSFSKAASFPQYHLYAKCTSDVSAHLEKCEYYKKWRVDYKSLPERVKLPSLSS